MTIHKLFIFNRHCSCIYHHEWNVRHSSTAAPPPSSPSKPENVSNVSKLSNSNIQISSKSHQGLDAPQEIQEKEIEQDSKLVYGIIFSLKNIIQKLGNSFNGYLSLSTNVYKLHFLETASGLRFVLLTDPLLSNLEESLIGLYDLYVEYIIKNPLESVDPVKIQNMLFETYLDKFIKAIPGF